MTRPTQSGAWLKSSWCYAHEKPFSTENPGIQNWHLPTSMSRTGRKWSADKALEVAESQLMQKALVGNVATEHAGLGYFSATKTNNVQGKEWQHLVQEEVRTGVEEV